jgi:hypothetical protein
MPMFMVLGIEDEGEIPNDEDGFISGGITQGWLTYIEARNARAAAEMAMEEVYDGNYGNIGELTLILHTMSGKATELRFAWKRPVEAQLVAL